MKKFIIPITVCFLLTWNVFLTIKLFGEYDAIANNQEVLEMQLKINEQVNHKLYVLSEKL
jgi:hypothetical protein